MPPVTTVAGSSSGAARRRGLRIAAAIALAGIAAVAGADLLRERAVSTSRHDLIASFVTIAGDAKAARAGPAVPRVLVNRAMLSARRAAALRSGPRQRELLDSARQQADHAIAARPFWAEALVAAAFVHSLTDGIPGRRRSAELLAASYVGAPFLRDGGAWRIGYAIDHWSELAEVTRRDVIEESFWLGSVDPVNASAILAAVSQSAAAAPFLARSRVLASTALRRTQARTPD